MILFADWTTAYWSKGRRSLGVLGLDLLAMCATVRLVVDRDLVWCGCIRRVAACARRIPGSEICRKQGFRPLCGSSARNGGVPRTACARIKHAVNYDVVTLPGRADAPSLDEYCEVWARSRVGKVGPRASASVTSTGARPDSTHTPGCPGRRRSPRRVACPSRRRA
jgi:hypothetical protein